MANTIGLLCDMIGVVVVFKFGWPQPGLSGGDNITGPSKSPTPTQITEKRVYMFRQFPDWLARVRFWHADIGDVGRPVNYKIVSMNCDTFRRCKP